MITITGREAVSGHREKASAATRSASLRTAASLQQRRLALEVLSGLQPALADPRRVRTLGIVAVLGGKLAQLLRVFQLDVRHGRRFRSVLGEPHATNFGRTGVVLQFSSVIDFIRAAAGGE